MATQVNSGLAQALILCAFLAASSVAAQPMNAEDVKVVVVHSLPEDAPRPARRTMERGRDQFDRELAEELPAITVLPTLANGETDGGVFAACAAGECPADWVAATGADVILVVAYAYEGGTTLGFQMYRETVATGIRSEPVARSLAGVAALGLGDELVSVAESLLLPGH